MPLNNTKLFNQAVLNKDVSSFYQITEGIFIINDETKSLPGIRRSLELFIYRKLRPIIKSAQKAQLIEQLDELKKFFALTAFDPNAVFFNNLTKNEENLLKIAIQEECDDLFNFMLEQPYINVNAPFNSLHETRPITWAIIKRNKSYLEQLVIRGAKLDYMRGFEPLSAFQTLVTSNKLSEDNDILFAQFLIDAGADLHYGEDAFDLPLHTAIEKGDYKICEFLLNHGADISLCTSSGRSPLMIAMANNNTMAKDNKLIWLLIDKGANIQYTHQQNNLLHYLSMLSDTSLENIELLIQKCLEHQLDINLINNKGDTPLHLAAKVGNINIMQMLIKYNAKFDLLDKKNKTAFDRLFSMKNENVADTAYLENEFNKYRQLVVKTIQEAQYEIFWDRQVKHPSFAAQPPEVLSRMKKRMYESFKNQFDELNIASQCLTLDIARGDILNYSIFLLFFQKYRTHPKFVSQCVQLLNEKPDSEFAQKLIKLNSDIENLSEYNILQKLYDLYAKAKNLPTVTYSLKDNNAFFIDLLQISVNLNNIQLAEYLFEKHLCVLDKKGIDKLKIYAESILTNEAKAKIDNEETLGLNYNENDFYEQFSFLIEKAINYEDTPNYQNALKISCTLVSLFKLPDNRKDKLTSNLAFLLAHSEDKQNSIRAFFEKPRIKAQLKENNCDGFKASLRFSENACKPS